jgi:hypothetical protein
MSSNIILLIVKLSDIESEEFQDHLSVAFNILKIFDREILLFVMVQLRGVNEQNVYRREDNKKI